MRSNFWVFLTPPTFVFVFMLRNCQLANPPSSVLVVYGCPLTMKRFKKGSKAHFVQKWGKSETWVCKPSFQSEVRFEVCLFYCFENFQFAIAVIFLEFLIFWYFLYFQVRLFAVATKLRNWFFKEKQMLFALRSMSTESLG